MDDQLYKLDFHLVGETPVWDRTLPGGRWLSACPLLFGRGCLLAGEGPRLEGDQWEFPTWRAALTALLTWNGHGEPAGWDRHVPSKRIRPGVVARPLDSAPPVGRSA